MLNIMIDEFLGWQRVAKLDPPSAASEPLVYAMQSQSVEVVQIILRYVIGVPVLLDPERLPTTLDQIGTMVNFYSTGSILADEKSYWDAERHRNVSRRVCRAWDAYLRSFENRLLHLDDVFGTGTIPSESIAKALYISLVREEPSTVSPCKGKFLAFLRQLDTPTKIRVLFFPYEEFNQDEVSTLAQWVPQLRTIVSAYGFCGPLRDFPNLVHGSTSIDTPDSLDLLCNIPATLRSLSVKIDIGDSKVAELGETNVAPGPLPSLEFLRVCISGQESVILLRQILQSTLGSRITALHLITSPRIMVDVDAILDLCPRIRLIYLNIFAYARIRRPDTHRQLHTLVIPFHIMGLVNPVIHEGLLVWPKWTQIRRVVSTHPWSRVREVRRNDLVIWASYWKRSPVRIEDRDGISIQEWLVNEADHA